MERKLYEAAVEGNVTLLLNLFRQDPFILDPTLTKMTPLHVASKLGHVDFVSRVLALKPELVDEPNPKGRTPLHLASAKGRVEVVRILLGVGNGASMCRARDKEGMNPVHVAAEKGEVEVIQELVRVGLGSVRERSNRGENPVHVCVKYGEGVGVGELVGGDGEVLNAKDGDGNTILHLAVARKQLETIKFLLNDKRMRKNAVNSNGMTAMDIFEQTQKRDEKDREIRRCLKRAKVLRAATANRTPRKTNKKWLENQRGALMVVASLIAGMDFQAGLNPPGGVWQDNSIGIAGTSIMAKTDITRYNTILAFNTVGFVSSLSAILLLISGLPCMGLFVIVVMVMIWIAITAMTFVYLSSMVVVTPINQETTTKVAGITTTATNKIILIALIVWLILVFFLLLGHVVNFIVKTIKGIVRLVTKTCCPSRNMNHGMV